MATTKRICGVPNCGKPDGYRGLCAKHHFRAIKGKDGPDKDEALQYLLPATRGNRATPDADGDDNDSTADNVARRKPTPRTRAQKGLDPSAKIQGKADERIAAITEFATTMDIPRVQYQGGFLFMKPNGLIAFLTDGGLLRDATIQLAEAK